MTTRLEKKLLKFGELKLADVLCDLEDILALRLGKERAERIVNRVEGEILGERMGLSDIEDLLRDQEFGMMDTEVDWAGYGVKEFVRDEGEAISIVTTNYQDKGG
jgi:hypothetical protein